VRGIPGGAALPQSFRPAARAAWRGLVQVLVGSDPAASRRRRSPARRWAVGTALAVVTLLLYAASLASLVVEESDRIAGSSKGVTPRLPGGSVPPGQHVLYAFSDPSLVAQPAVQAAIALAVVVPLPLVLRYPLLSWRIGWLGLLLVPLFKISSLGDLPGSIWWWGGLPWNPAQILVVLTAFCAAGVRVRRAALCWLWALTLVPWWFWILWQRSGVATAAFGSAAFLALAVAADSVRSRQRAQQALAGQAERAEREQAQRAVLERRARTARELHDVVAHHMSLIAIRAETAPYRLADLPEPVRAEFDWLSGSAREAMADMRRLLGMLRNGEPAAHAPQPGLPDLPGLIDTARQAGMAVELSVRSVLDHVPSSAGACAYRVVQEALSNAGRHAGGAPVTVALQHSEETLELRVTNGPGVAGAPGGTHANGHAPGHGLAGMRERVELLGGTLSAGAVPDGGFAVSAVLPLSGATA
jgi:signal transduction histidine kinase